MGDSFAQIRAIAATSIEETLRRKVLYLVAIFIVALAAVIGTGTMYLKMATDAGEFEAASGISAGFVQVALGLWTYGGMFLAVCLGAIGISSEINARTIVNVLSRPVGRSAYMAGRWLGIAAFLAAFQLVGMGVALLLTVIFDVHYTPMLWFGFAEIFTNVLFFSGVSLSLSVVMPALPAGAIAVILSIAPQLVGNLVDHPRWLYKLPASVLYYLGPASMPVDLMSESFSRQMLQPRYSLYSMVLAENLLYTLAFFAVGCFLFSRKELQLR